MNGNSFLVLDTNIVLYHLANRLQKSLEKKQYAISIITEIELLSYPKIQADEINLIENFVAQTTVIKLTDSIKIATVALRKRYKLKLPDAIIAATASRLQSPLLTNDKKLLNISEIETISVPLS